MSSWRPQGGSAAPLSRRLAFRPQLLSLEERAVPDATATTGALNDKQIYAVGADAGNQPLVQVFNPDGSLKYSFTAYNPNFRGGVRVAVGDITGDGIPDIVTAPGPGMAPDVKVFDGSSGAEIANFMAYADVFTGGVYVAVADVNGDGRPDIITGAGQGGGPHVRVFDGKWVVPPLHGHGQPVDLSTPPTATPPLMGTGILTEFFAYDPRFTGGVRVAAADLTGAGHAEIITGAGPGGGPHVRVIDPTTGKELASFMAFASTYTGGVYVTAGDIGGDGKAEVAVGSGVGLAQVKLYNDDFSLLRSYTIAETAAAMSVRVAMADVDGDGKQDLVLGMNGELEVRDPLTNATERTSTPFDPTVVGSVFVG
jgi:hypothetical protein